MFGDVVKMIWGSDYRSLTVPDIFQGSFSIFGLPFPRYNLFLMIIGPLVAFGLWFLTNKTKIGKIARAAAVDREMVGAGCSPQCLSSDVFLPDSGCAGRSNAEYHPGHGSLDYY